MEKVRLSPEELEIQSFTVPTVEDEERGTVHGHYEPSELGQCYTQPNDWQNSCAVSCKETCQCGTWGWTISRCY